MSAKQEHILDGADLYKQPPIDTEHLLLAANLVDRAMAEIEKAGYSVAVEKLRAVHQHLIKLVSYLDTGEIK